MIQKLTTKELIQVCGGSGTDKGVKPKVLQFSAPESVIPPVSATSLDSEKDKQLP